MILLYLALLSHACGPQEALVPKQLKPFYYLNVEGGNLVEPVTAGERVQISVMVRLPGGIQFWKWVTKDQDLIIDNPWEPSTFVRMPNRDATVTAIFRAVSRVK